MQIFQRHRPPPRFQNRIERRGMSHTPSCSPTRAIVQIVLLLFCSLMDRIPRSDAFDDAIKQTKIAKSVVLDSVFRFGVPEKAGMRSLVWKVL